MPPAGRVARSWTLDTGDFRKRICPLMGCSRSLDLLTTKRGLLIASRLEVHDVAQERQMMMSCSLFRFGGQFLMKLADGQAVSTSAYWSCLFFSQVVRVLVCSIRALEAQEWRRTMTPPVHSSPDPFFPTHSNDEGGLAAAKSLKSGPTTSA